MSCYDVQVFSDEFEQEGRTFNDGEDPRWTALDKNDYTNDALHYYSSDNAYTTGGILNITTENKIASFKALNETTREYFAQKKYYKSAMLQGWNKFCITGGIVEVRAKLPGNAYTGGLWPAIWLLGNLARATFVGSSDYMWPWSYDQCTDKNRLSQEINACSKVNHYNMAGHAGRGAPEIDILEAMGGPVGPLPHTTIERPYFSASFQVAPGIDENRPDVGRQPANGTWYTGMEYGNVTNSSLNNFFYGVTLVHKPSSYTYQSDALSANMHINHSHYDEFHTYRVEWEPSDEEGNGGHIKWFADNELVYGIGGDVLKKTSALIPNEPMYMLLNTAISDSWGFPIPCPTGCSCECYECGNPDCECALPPNFCNNLPAHFEVDYVRVYQAIDDPNHVLGCSTKARPTSTFIEGHKERYTIKGKSEPLLPVRDSTGICSKDADCGGEGKGSCSDVFVCICEENYTGPNCLAHNAFYDDPYIPVSTPFEVMHMILPNPLFKALIVLAGAFVVVVWFNARKSQKSLGYIAVRDPPEDVVLSDFQTSGVLPFPQLKSHS